MVLVLEVVMSHVNMLNDMMRKIRQLLLKVMDKHIGLFNYMKLISQTLLRFAEIFNLFVRSLCDIM